MKIPVKEKLFTKEFIILNIISFLVYANFAVFFNFYLYLDTLPINPIFFGLLISVFSIMALVLRPIISPFFTTGNARRWLFISTVVVIISLLAYNISHDFWSMLIVRIIHGTAHVVLATALTVCLVNVIPKSRSGQAFGLITVIMLLPFGVIPPLLSPMIKYLGGFTAVLSLTAAIMLLIFPLALLLKRETISNQGSPKQKIGGRELVQNLKRPQILFTLLIMLMLYSGYAPVFFFIEGFGDNINITNPGIFFTITTACEIGVRVVAGSFFDKTRKELVVGLSLLAVAGGYYALAYTSGPLMYYVLAIFLGLGWGVVMPVLNGLLFDVSPEKLRGANTNLGLSMFQAGYFFGPLIGGVILSGWNYTILFYFCSILTFIGLLMVPFIYKTTSENTATDLVP